LVSAYIFLQCETGTIAAVTHRIENERPELQGHSTFGQYDIVLFYTAETPDEITNLILEFIHKIPGIRNTETLICMQAIGKEKNKKPPS
jgi:DNA-binding Lrp family transcriptional regulator